MEEIINKLIVENTNHLINWNENIMLKNDVIPYGCLLIIKNNDINIENLDCRNNFINVCIKNRLYPFINYLKKIDLSGVDVKIIVPCVDTINNCEFKFKIYNNIPIFISSLKPNDYKKYNNTILIPNLYTYNNCINKEIEIVKKKDINYDEKSNTMCFAGDYSHQSRAVFAKWGYQKKNVITCFRESFGNKINDIYMTKQKKPIEDQLKSKFLVNLPGCHSGTSWNRLAWQMYSNSIVLNLKNESKEYWYSLLNEKPCLI